MHRYVISIFLIISSLAGAAEYRTWSNEDKTKTFEAELVSSKDNHVTLRLKSFKTITVEIDKLHTDDQLWIKQHHSVNSGAVTNKNIKKVDENAIFDTLVFGDNRDTVTKKLYASKLVTSTVSPELMGRTGLNNVFVTRDKIAGLSCSLAFEWDENGGLTACMLQTENKSAQEYATTLKNSWQEFETLLTSIYGKSVGNHSMPDSNSIKDGRVIFSLTWSLDQGGTILLGASHVEGKYQVVVKFTKEVH